MQLAQDIFHHLEEDTKFNLYKKDGDAVNNGETAKSLPLKPACAYHIKSGEELVLNCNAAHERHRNAYQ